MHVSVSSWNFCLHPSWFDFRPPSLFFPSGIEENSPIHPGHLAGNLSVTQGTPQVTRDEPSPRKSWRAQRGQRVERKSSGQSGVCIHSHTSSGILFPLQKSPGENFFNVIYFASAPREQSFRYSSPVCKKL